eukprot:2932837-Alexandrium_andersonii.AAC.1
MAVPVVGRCCWAASRAMGTPRLCLDPWAAGDALAQLRRDTAADISGQAASAEAALSSFLVHVARC